VSIARRKRFTRRIRILLLSCELRRGGGKGKDTFSTDLRGGRGGEAESLYTNGCLRNIEEETRFDQGVETYSKKAGTVPYTCGVWGGGGGTLFEASSWKRGPTLGTFLSYEGTRRQRETFPYGGEKRDGGGGLVVLEALPFLHIKRTPWGGGNHEGEQSYCLVDGVSSLQYHAGEGI